MARAQFQKGQKVWVECVGAWAQIEKVQPVWAKGFEEPVRVTYDVGLGREFLGHELLLPSDDPAANAGDGLRAPVLEMVSLTRGINGRASCDASGLLTVSVEWPRGTDYKLRDLGFEFRVVGGEDRLSIFPKAPLTGRVDGRRSEFVFLWQDGPPAQQGPIDLVVEVRAVTPDNRRGPPAQLRIAAAPGS